MDRRLTVGGNGPAGAKKGELLMMTMTRRALPALLLGGAFASRARADDAKFRLRCSLDTSATHGRTVYVGEYLKQLEEASGGRIAT